MSKIKVFDFSTLLSEKENQLRKLWLVLLILTSVVPFSLHYNLVNEIALFEALITWIGTYIVYYCAYKNPGTIILTLSLIFYPIGRLVAFYLYTKVVSWNFGETLFLLFNLTLDILWCYFSFKLLKINKKANRSIFTKLSPETIEAIQSSRDLESLNTTFHDAMQKWPAFASLLTAEYKKMKIVLTESGSEAT